MNRPGDKKQAVPKRDEKPIHGLVSDKNFIVANAVENILAGKLPSPSLFTKTAIIKQLLLELRSLNFESYNLSFQILWFYFLLSSS